MDPFAMALRCRGPVHAPGVCGTATWASRPPGGGPRSPERVGWRTSRDGRRGRAPCAPTALPHAGEHHPFVECVAGAEWPGLFTGTLTATGDTPLPADRPALLGTLELPDRLGPITRLWLVCGYRTRS
ncbi:hypothetical protein [Kitasatospora sp. NPDC057015]|uniref:hypothetical protein n=1 Tax=Kitasatospora sp. NPDC057015 TaxID=3346001 RepID=UPI00363219CA